MILFLYITDMVSPYAKHADIASLMEQLKTTNSECTWVQEIWYGKDKEPSQLHASKIEEKTVVTKKIYQLREYISPS